MGLLRHRSEEMQKAVLTGQMPSLVDLKSAWASNDVSAIEEASKCRIWGHFASEERAESFGIISAVTLPIGEVITAKQDRTEQEARHAALRTELLNRVRQPNDDTTQPVGFIEIIVRWHNVHSGAIERERAFFVVNVGRDDLAEFANEYNQVAFIYMGPDTEHKAYVYANAVGARRSPYRSLKIPLDLYRTGEEAAAWAHHYLCHSVIETAGRRIPVGVELSVYNDPKFNVPRPAKWFSRPSKYQGIDYYCNIPHYVGENPSFGWRNFLDLPEGLPYEQPPMRVDSVSEEEQRLYEGRRAERNEELMHKECERIQQEFSGKGCWR